MKKFILAPSIIAADFAHIADEISACESAGADWIHVDVMDGHFVPTITIGPLFVEALKRTTKLPLDVHLMIEKPENHIKAFADAGASNITVHIEACENAEKAINQIKSLGCKAGIALNPSTPASLLDSVLSSVDIVLVMSVNPGYSGQKFMTEMVSKVEELRNTLNTMRSDAYLEADGGISLETLPLMKSAGANVFVTGNAAFKHPHGTLAGVRELIMSLRGE